MDDGFLYQPAPNPRGGFTSRAVKGEQITEAELDSAVAAETGLLGKSGGHPWPVAVYLIVMAVITLVSVWMAEETHRRDLT